MEENRNGTGDEFTRQHPSNPYLNQGQQYTDWSTQQQSFTPPNQAPHLGFTVPPQNQAPHLGFTVPPQNQAVGYPNQDQPPPYSPPPYSPPAYTTASAGQPYLQAAPPAVHPYLQAAPPAEQPSQAARDRRAAVRKRIIIIRIAICLCSVIASIICGVIAYYSS